MPCSRGGVGVADDQDARVSRDALGMADRRLSWDFSSDFHSHVSDPSGTEILTLAWGNLVVTQDKCLLRDQIARP